MDKSKLYYYKNVVKRHLREIKEKIQLSKKEMERSYYRDRYDVQLQEFAEALGVRKENLEIYI